MLNFIYIYIYFLLYTLRYNTEFESSLWLVLVFFDVDKHRINSFTLSLDTMYIVLKKNAH